MTPDQTVMSTIGVKVGVRVTMMSAVTSGPPLDRTLNSSGTSQGETILERFRRVV